MPAAVERSPGSVTNRTPRAEVAARAARLQGGEVLVVGLALKNLSQCGKREHVLHCAPTVLRDIAVPLGVDVTAGRSIVVVSCCIESLRVPAAAPSRHTRLLLAGDGRGQAHGGEALIRGDVTSRILNTKVDVLNTELRVLRAWPATPTSRPSRSLRRSRIRWPCECAVFTISCTLANTEPALTRAAALSRRRAACAAAGARPG